jgi:hypothetical protein
MATHDSGAWIRIARLGLVLSLTVATTLQAGLRFEPVSGPAGSEVFALSTDSGVLWAASIRGVHRYAGGQWTLDGLGSSRVTSIAASAAGIWVVSGGSVYRRVEAGTYEKESLPPAAFSVSFVALHADVPYAGGAGLYRKTASGWASVAGFEGRSISALAPSEFGLLIGFSTGGAARFDGTSSQFFSERFPVAEAVQCLAPSALGILAGTQRGLYSWDGAMWTADTLLGVRDVRAVTNPGTALRVATTTGVLRSTGAGWEAENSGLSTLATSALAVSGSDTFLATSGGPLYRLAGSSWQPLGGPHAASVTSLLTPSRTLSGCGSEDGTVVAGFRGAGIGVYPPSRTGPCPLTTFSLPEGCGDVRALGDGSTVADLVAATGCGPYFFSETSGSFVPSGLPANTVFTSLTNTANGIVAGSESSSVFRFVGSGWSADSNGLPLGAAITATGEASGTLFAGTTQGLFVRGATGRWATSQIGIPSSAIVSAIGSAAGRAWSGLASGGIYRRTANGAAWEKDSYGVNAAPIFQFASGGGVFAVAAGTAGPAIRSEGGWSSETLGLASGADVRSVAISSVVKSSKNPKTKKRLFAGTAGHGLFSANLIPVTRIVPVVLDLEGAAYSRFRTELTLGNRSSRGVALQLTFNPAPGFGAPLLAPGTVEQHLAAGSEKRIVDVISFLRLGGLAIPPTPENRIAGSLSITASYPDEPDTAVESVYAIARTFSLDGNGGSFGLFYSAPNDIETAEESATVYGLRRVSGESRSNLAVIHVPGRGEDPIDLELRVFDAMGKQSGDPLQKTLLPGEWYQYNDILGIAGLADGSFGYVQIRRVSGGGTWTAYGVVNDAVTSDGSYLSAVRPGGIAAVRRQIVPVVLDVLGAGGARFTTEVTLVNNTSIATAVDLAYQPAPGYGQDTAGGPIITINLAAREQRTIGNILQFLRENGFVIPDPTSETPQAGTLTVDFRFVRSLDAGDTLALARTTTPNPDVSTGGRFGLFYRAFAEGAGARSSALVPALVQNAAFRSNLAVVHASGGSDDTLVLSVQLYRAETGAPIGDALRATLYPGDWFQWNRVLEAAGVTEPDVNAFARVTRVSGDDTFFAYGVVNDNQTSDGSYVEMIPDEN